MKSKWNAGLKRKPYFNTISRIGQLLKGEVVENPTQVKQRCWSKRYAAITSCDVDRSFSPYKLIVVNSLLQWKLQLLHYYGTFSIYLIIAYPTYSLHMLVHFCIYWYVIQLSYFIYFICIIFWHIIFNIPLTLY